MNDVSQPWPTELRLHKDRKTLTIAFDNSAAPLTLMSQRRV